MKRPLVLVCVAGLALGADAPKGEGDRDKLQGTWKVVSLTTDGKSTPDKAVKEMTLTFKGDRFTLKGEEGYSGRFKLDPGKSPKQIDTTFVDDADKEKGKAQGIYELKGDRLTVAWAEEGKGRPTKFASKEGSGVRLIVVERAKGR